MALLQTLLLVAKYGDTLETFPTEADAVRFIRRNLPVMPDEVWDEGEDCEVVTEYEVEVKNGQVKLLALA